MLILKTLDHKRSFPCKLFYHLPPLDWPFSHHRHHRRHRGRRRRHRLRRHHRRHHRPYVDKNKEKKKQRGYSTGEICDSRHGMEFSDRKI